MAMVCKLGCGASHASSPTRRPSVAEQWLRLVLHMDIRRPSALEREKCLSALPSTSLAHVGPLCGRPAAQRSHHPPGPQVYQGSAQVAGLLKERSQDYFLAATDIALERDVYCSQTSWTDFDESQLSSSEGCCSGGDCASAAGCSTSTSGTGVVTSPTSGGVASIVVTGVFDGHGGEMSARYAQKAILSYVANDKQLHQSLGAGDAEGVSMALRSTFRKVDDELLDLAASSSSSNPIPNPNPNPNPTSGSKPARNPTSGDPVPSPSRGPGMVVAGNGDFRDGTTALVTVQLGGLLAVANAGDSRAVMCRQGEAVRLSRDHTPALRAERERIEAAGGQVVVARGAARVVVPLTGSKDVMRALSVSRSLGDPDFKANGLVICDPDVSLLPLVPHTDSFLIAASDGLWGRVGDQEAVDCVKEVLEEYSHMSSASRGAAAKAAARRLLRLALDQGSVDDVTVVVSVFAWAP